MSGGRFQRRRFRDGRRWQKTGVYRSCRSKQQFLNEEDAHAGLPPGWKVYRCHHCSGWHRASNGNRFLMQERGK